MTKAMQMKKEKLDIAAKHLLENTDGNMVQLVGFLFDVSSERQIDNKIIIDVGKFSVPEGFITWLSTGWQKDFRIVLGEHDGELWFTVRGNNAAQSMLSLNLNFIKNTLFEKHKFSDDAAMYTIRFTNEVNNVDYFIHFIRREANK